MESSALGVQQTDNEVYEALNRHPILKARMMNLLALVESADVERADDAERWAIRELRGMGQEILKDWAANQAEQVAAKMSADEVIKDGKKKSSGIARMAKSK